MTKRLSAHILLLPQEIQLLDSLVRAEQRRDPRCNRSDIMRAALGAHRPGTRGPFLDVARAVGEDGMCPTCRRPVEVREVLALTPPEPIPPPDFGDDFGDLGLTGVMAGKKKKPRRAPKKKSAPQSPAEPLVPLSTSDKKGFTEILTEMAVPTPDEKMVAAAMAAVKEMTPEEHEAQRRSFAYGNVKLHNDDITRAMVDISAEEIQKYHGDVAFTDAEGNNIGRPATPEELARHEQILAMYPPLEDQPSMPLVEDAAGTAALRAEVASVIADKTDLEPTVTKFEKDVADDVKHFLKNQSDVYIPKYDRVETDHESVAHSPVNDYLNALPEHDGVPRLDEARARWAEELPTRIAVMEDLLAGGAQDPPTPLTLEEEDEDETEVPAERLPDGAHEHSPAGHVGDERAELPAGPVADAGTGVHAAEDRARGGGPVPDDGGAGRGSPAGGADECTEGRGDVGSGGGEQGQADRVAPAAPRWSVVALPIDGSAPYWFYPSEFLFPPTTKDLALAEAWRIHQNAAGSELDNDYDVAEFRAQDAPPEEP